MFTADEMAADRLTLLPTGQFIIIDSANPSLSHIIIDMIPLQYTGLNDKNGKEIFEGDIVQRNGHFYTVKYIGSSFILSIGDRPISILELMERHSKGSTTMFYFEDLEIIGNIYETPHLLHAQRI